MGRAVLNRRVDQVEDIAADPGHSFAPVLSPWSVIAVPILRDGQPLGAISIGRPAMGPFSASQVALLQTFAEQAVIAITSAETYRALHARTADLQETLEYQTATSDVLKVISRSTFDPQPIFDTIVSTAARLCDADDGIITTLEGDAYKLVSSFAAAPEFDAVMKGRLFPVNRGSLTGRIALEGEVIHIPDIACDPEYTQTETLTLQKNRTMLGVPLLREGGAVGTINLGRLKVEPFNERQIDLVRTFAAQAVIAIENARLITEQSEALEQQTATAEVLQVINASPGDLAPMFDAMLEKALRLCGGTIGGIFIFDGDHSVTSAVQGVTAAFQEYNDKYPMDKLQPGTVPARIIETRGPVQNPDLTAGENYHAGHPYARALVALGGIRAVLAVPLLKDGVAIGMVAIYRQEAGAFSDKQIALLQNFAAQAVIAMENARLITEQREALEQQTATAEVLQVINASPGDLVPVFNTMLDSALRLCDASFGQLITFDGVGFRAAAWQNFPPEPNRPGVTTPPAPGMALHRLIHGEEVVHVPDITADEIYRSGNPTRRRLADEFGGRTAIWVALKKDTLLLGAFVIYRTEVRPFSQKQIALLQSFAAQTVIAMENARLITEQREALKQQTATAEVLQVINRSRGDLVPVFDAILESAHSLCDIARGSLELYDGVRFHAVAVRGLSAALADKLRHGYSASDNPATRPLIEGGRLSHIRDLAETDYSITRSSVETDTARTLLCVPLRRDVAWHDCLGSRGGSSILRERDRSPGKFRGAGSDCDRKCAAADGATRSTGAADRDRRGVAGDQRIAGQPRTCVRGDPGEGAHAVRRGRRLFARI